jgi:hypothetical protein
MMESTESQREPGRAEGAWAGVVNVADKFTFDQITSLDNYRNSLWDGTLQNSWEGKVGNGAAWVGTTALQMALTDGALQGVFKLTGFGGNMSVAVGGARWPYLLHFQYGVEGTWQEAVGFNFGRMWVRGAVARGFVISDIPVLYPRAVLTAAETDVLSCFTSTLSAFARGWGL